MDVDDYVIRVDHLSKEFKLPHEKNNSIKSAVVNFWRREKGYEIQKALDDITFDVKKGDFFGIVGRNGSGKSTLLKLIAGIYTPTQGGIHVKGSLTPFIELGVGFNPELTGRENVFLNGSLLGFNRKEMMQKYNDIVEFAEIEKFMDQKLKNYSSGMQVRLAFSIAIQAKGDILILDEVLAVGDEAFQRKCVNVFEKYKSNNQTIVLVTHDMSVVERFCNKALLIKDGSMVEMGKPRLIAQMYSDLNKDAYSKQRRRIEKKRTYTGNIKIELLDYKTKNEKNRFVQGEKMRVKLSWKREGVKNAGVAIMKQSGEYIFGPNTYRDKFKISGKEINYLVDLDIGPGEYFVKAGLFGAKDTNVLEFVDEGPSFNVEEPKRKNKWGGLAHLEYNWE
jgi:ABC-2 type transport system ATP-binding protein